MVCTGTPQRGMSREKEVEPITHKLQRTNLDLEQEIQRKCLEVNDQELENTKQIAVINKSNKSSS